MIRTESKRGQQATPTFFIPPTERRFARSVRHTYASLLLAVGFSAAYVQEQLGHASIELTVGTYGRWLRKQAPGALDYLDRGEVVAETTEVVAAVAGDGSGQRPEPTEMAERESAYPTFHTIPMASKKIR